MDGVNVEESSLYLSKLTNIKLSRNRLQNFIIFQSRKKI
jgi:hypothetical protein